MHQESLSSKMRSAALAAPSAAIERQELFAAQQQEQLERVASLGDRADLVLDLERQLRVAIDDRKRAQNEARYATRKLEQMYDAIGSILGRDVRDLGIVRLGTALSDSKFKLTMLAGYVGKADTLDDLAKLKRIVSNMGVVQPATMMESAAMMGFGRSDLTRMVPSAAPQR